MAHRYALLDRDGTILWMSRVELAPSVDSVIGMKPWEIVPDPQQAASVKRAIADAALDGAAGPIDVRVDHVHLRVWYRRINDMTILVEWARIHVENLTPRELDVLEKMCASVPTREAAAQLGIGVSSFETHRRSLLRKTDCRGPGQLALWARDRGLV